MYRLTLEDSETNTTASAFLMVSHMPVGWLAFQGSQGRKVRLEDNTVAKLDLPNPKRTE
jgi:hypothetical protein